MSTSRAAPYRSRARTNDPARDFGKSVDGGIVDGQLREAEFTGGPSTGSVPHSLGRAYRGAFVVGQNTTVVSVRVLTPEDADDAATAVDLAFSIGFNGLVRLWVF